MEIQGEKRISLLMELEDVPGALESALHVFTEAGVNLTHIESRPARGNRFDFFVDCDSEPDNPAMQKVIRNLEQLASRLLVLDAHTVPWFPRHIGELDRIAEHTLDAGVQLDAEHPGFNDPAYRARRAEIDALARNFRHGQPLPEVTYTAQERQTWRHVYERLRPLHEAHACSAYLAAVRELERECGYGPETIPQFAPLSGFLEGRTGFRLRPVPGLLAPRDFLAGLAFRVFFATQYVRHHSRPLYTPEPDVCHELIGHAPMLADQAFADLSQEIGLASLGARNDDIDRLARCYWHSVEFGLVKEAGRRAYGAGLLSSYGELLYACGGELQGHAVPEYLAWDPDVAAERAYPITDYQPAYFVARSLHEARARMRTFCQNLPRPFYARYNDATQSIWVDRAIRRLSETGR